MECNSPESVDERGSEAAREAGRPSGLVGRVPTWEYLIFSQHMPVDEREAGARLVLLVGERQC